MKIINLILITIPFALVGLMFALFTALNHLIWHPLFSSINLILTNQDEDYVARFYVFNFLLVSSFGMLNEVTPSLIKLVVVISCLIGLLTWVSLHYWSIYVWYPQNKHNFKEGNDE